MILMCLSVTCGRKAKAQPTSAAGQHSEETRTDEMSKATIPGFTADAGCYQSDAHYRAGSVAPLLSQRNEVVPALPFHCFGPACCWTGRGGGGMLLFCCWHTDTGEIGCLPA